MSKTRSRLALAATVLLVLAAAFAAITQDDPVTPREARMLELAASGDWAPVEEGRGGPVPEVRPLPLWSMLAFQQQLGPSPTTGRLPGLLLALGTLFVVRRTLLKTDGPTAAWLVPVVLTTTYFFAYAAVTATQDVFGVCFSLLAFCFAYRALFDDSPWHWVPACGAAALLMLSTGVSGPLTAVLAVGIWAAVIGVDRSSLHDHLQKLLIGVLLVYGLLTGVYTLLYLEHGKPVLDTLWAMTVEGETRSAQFYIRSFLWGLLPWSLLLPFAMLLPGRSDRSETRHCAFAMLWGGVGFLVLCLSPEKQHFLTAPVMLPLSIGVGLALSSAYEHHDLRWPRLATWSAMLLGCLFIRDNWLYGSGVLYDLFKGPGATPDVRTLNFWLGLTVASAAAAAVAMALPRARREAVWITIAASTFFWVLLIRISDTVAPETVAAVTSNPGLP